jgi:glycerol kinase
MWIMDNVEGARKKIKNKNIYMGNIDSWIIWNLSKGRYHVTDYSNASRTLLLNIHTLSWDEEILEWTGIPEHILPEPKPSSGVMAQTDPDIFFGATVPIAGAAGDQQAATFGQTCFKPGMAKNSYGTALALMMNIGQKPIPSKHGLTTDLAWKIGDRVEYALEGVIFIGGAAIQWLKEGLGIIKSSAECSELAEKVPDSGGVYLVPAFTGLCAPYWDMYARGIIVGITRGTTREHIARSAMESIAYQTRDVLEAMEADSKEKARSLRVDGGATKSDFLMQFQADILGIEVVRPAITEMAALGACYLAGLGVGFWKSQDEIARQWKIEKVFRPAMDENRREELYADWKRAVERSFKWEKPYTSNSR